MQHRGSSPTAGTFYKGFDLRPRCSVGFGVSGYHADRHLQDVCGKEICGQLGYNRCTVSTCDSRWMYVCVGHPMPEVPTTNAQNQMPLSRILVLLHELDSGAGSCTTAQMLTRRRSQRTAVAQGDRPSAEFGTHYNTSSSIGTADAPASEDRAAKRQRMSKAPEVQPPVEPATRDAEVEPGPRPHLKSQRGKGSKAATFGATTLVGMQQADGVAAGVEAAVVVHERGGARSSGSNAAAGVVSVLRTDVHLQAALHHLTANDPCERSVRAHCLPVAAHPIHVPTHACCTRPCMRAPAVPCQGPLTCMHTHPARR